MANLKNQIAALADTFAAGVLSAIRSASLEEILAGGSGAAPAPTRRGPGRPRKTAPSAAPAAAEGDEAADAPAGRGRKGRKAGRLARRSPADIEHVIGLIVTALGRAKAGLRSEQLQKTLKLSKKEIVRPLAEALGSKKIRKTGEKRATTYFAK
jgi:hypothetical protein